MIFFVMQENMKKGKIIILSCDGSNISFIFLFYKSTAKALTIQIKKMVIVHFVE